jgi:hypothetical protein
MVGQYMGSLFNIKTILKMNNQALSSKELKKWRTTTRYFLNKRFPSLQHSFLIEDTIDKALAELFEPNSKIRPSLNALQHVARLRLIDELRRSQRRKTTYESTDILEKIPPLSMDEENIEEEEKCWNTVVAAVEKIQNQRRRVLLQTYYKAQTGCVDPQRLTIEDLRSQFEMCSAGAVRIELNRGLTDLRNILLLTR